MNPQDEMIEREEILEKIRKSLESVSDEQLLLISDIYQDFFEYKDVLKPEDLLDIAEAKMQVLQEENSILNALVSDNTDDDNIGFQNLKRMRVPKVAIKIFSSSMTERDIVEQKRLYERAGVKEYWMSDQSNGTVEIFTLGKDRRYGEPDLYNLDDEIVNRKFQELLNPQRGK